AALAKKPVETYLQKRKAAKELEALGIPKSTAERQVGLISTDLPRAPMELKQPYV
ncbi:unnamed protein product, partial [marine sediment metagenome]